LRTDEKRIRAQSTISDKTPVISSFSSIPLAVSYTI